MASTESSDSGQQASLQESLHAALAVNVLGNLLQRLSVSVEAGALLQACQKVEQELPESSPVKRLGAVFHALQLPGVQAAVLNWTRFDHRCLPAMLFFQGQWQLIEPGNNNLFVLTDDNGQSVEHEAEALDGCLVLWLKVRPKRSEASGFSIKDNKAANLIWGELFKHPRWLRDVILATLLVNLLAVSTSLFAMQVYDRVVPTLAYATLWTLVAGMALVVSLDWLLKTIRARILDSVSCEVNDAVSQKVFDHVMNLQLDSRPRSLGTLAAQVSGLDSVRQFFSSGVVFALVDMPFALLFIGFIAIIGGPIGWVYLLLLPVAAVLGWSGQKRLRLLMKEQLIRSHERQGLLVDAIQGTESIRSSNASWRFSEQWREITRSIAHYNIQQKAINNLTTVTTSSLSTAAYVGAIIVGVHQIEAGNLTMGALIACSILGGRVIAPVSQTVQYLTQWQNVAESLQMVNQVLMLDTERRPEQNLLMPDEKPESVALDNVQFSYPQSPIKQLDIESLQFNAGDRVLLLGPIGSGKSTLLKVMAGLYRPSQGRVKLGSADLWEIDPHVVADNIGYLPQSVHLFKGTLRSNLALSGAISDSHLLKVCENLGIDRIAADNPQSMDLEISEGGEGLSGGQKQLVGLGRIFLAQPRIWLLDEPTASLDSDSDAKVLQAIESTIKPEDILIISTHRVTLALKIANRLVMMQQGKVVADGKPDEVMPKVMRQANSSSASKQSSKKSMTPFQSMNKGPNNVI